MTKRELTCGNCPNAQLSSGVIGIIHCGISGEVIPHSVDYAAGDITFHRVPPQCPRPDSEVRKSDKAANPTQWVHTTLDAIKLNRQPKRS